MFNMGWTELLVIGVVALIVIGPQDLPEMFRQLGRFTGKIRSMGREFQRAMDQAAKESGVKDVAKDLKTATSPKALGLDAVKGAADRFEKWDPLKQAKPAAKPVAEKKTASADAAYTDAAPPDTAGPAKLTGKAADARTTAKAAEKATDKPALGPATQALADKQAARKAVLAETTAKLKAIDAGEASAKAAPKAPAKPKAPARPKAAPKVGSAAKGTAADTAKPEPKPRAPRKKKAPEA